LIDFIAKAFGGSEVYRKERPDGAIIHAEIRIGDSMLMLGEETTQFGPMPTSIYLYVTDCDAVYHCALDSGGVSVFPIMTLLLVNGMAASKTPAATSGGLPHTSKMCRRTKRSDAGGNSRCHESRANPNAA
jgi:hypothetical protein